MTTHEFTARFTELNKTLFGIAMRITRNVEDANDLLQEAAMRAFKNRERFEMGTNFRAWMATIMKNTFINNYRRNSKRKHLEMPYEKFSFAIGNVKSEANATSNLMMEELDKMVDELGDGYKQPFKMFNEGYHYDEIADQMDIPMGTVKSRIFYARKQLKDKIRANFPHSYPGM
ncbi:MAG: sigma-70 family RNA polymerase sigma factor [Saprospiraceae bacterium]